MIGDHISINMKPWTDLLERAGREMPSVISRALNRAGDAAATVVVRELASETGLAVRKVAGELDISRSSGGDLTYTISIPARHLTLKEFGPREVKAGVSARPWAKRRTFPHSFLINDVPFVRMGADRFPIRPLFGPSLATEVGRGGAIEAARRKFVDVMPRRLAHELSRVLPITDPGVDGDY